ncbi:hypothetical protein Glove_139g7 [Diversispora epigaea]|uniref:Protein kinase domain-containing protein n=1 Tax=Diversispora epigaea TaxID=1348612 RepID=A0A397J4P9_9GLOM|nr:hypothetical protein Glove_139g7 [Diversispora epigaea]
MKSKQLHLFLLDQFGESRTKSSNNHSIIYGMMKILLKTNSNISSARLNGITKVPETHKYMMVLEYYKGRSLSNYLNNNIDNLHFNDKLEHLYNLDEFSKFHKLVLVHRDFHPRIPAESELEFKGNFLMPRARLQRSAAGRQIKYKKLKVEFLKPKNKKKAFYNDSHRYCCTKYRWKSIHSTLKISEFGGISVLLPWENFFPLFLTTCHCQQTEPTFYQEKLRIGILDPQTKLWENFFPLFLTTCHCQQTEPTFYQEKLRIGILDPQTKLVIA